MTEDGSRSADGFDPSQLQGMQGLRRLADIPDTAERHAVERGLHNGLEAASSVQDREISTFVRGAQPAFAGINTFLKSPYCENIHDISGYEAAIIGAPFDMGTTYRPGCRFGPQAVRRVSAVYDGYSLDLAVDLNEELALCDAGDVFVIPANIEKTFDQIDKAVSHVTAHGVFPVIIGGDHSIGYPDVRALAKYVEGDVGIIHFDRHIDIQERDMDERMHTTHWYHATNIPNVSPRNLVQLGIGGWYGSRAGLRTARERDTTVMTIGDIEKLGIDKAVEIALEQAWDGTEAVFLSFDIDSVDGGIAPGTGTPEPAGLSPREALRALRTVAREGICGMEVVEISPPYDVSDTTAQLGCRAVMDVLGTLVSEGKLGVRSSTSEQTETPRKF